MTEGILKESVPKYGEYADGKLWFSRRGSIVTIGLTTQATEEVGEITSIELPDEDDTFDKGDIAVTIDGNLGNIEVTTPAAGVIKEVNASIKDEANIVTEDPLEEGWLVKLEIEDTSDLKEFANIID